MNKKGSLFHISKRDALPLPKALLIRGGILLLALVFWLIVAILRSVNRRRAKKRAMRARRPGARQGREDRRG